MAGTNPTPSFPEESVYRDPITGEVPVAPIATGGPKAGDWPHAARWIAFGLLAAGMALCYLLLHK